jgi:predicted dehydrogenase
MVKNEELDAVLIATPTHTHKEIACFCAEQGLHIFLEKPMARTLEECDAIIDSISDNRIKLLVGHVLRFWPTYGSIKYYLDGANQEIGEIQTITAKRLGTFPWSKWFADQSKSGGVTLDLAIHDIDYASWLMGKVTSVSSKAITINRHEMDVFGESLTTLTFENSKKANCEGSWAKPTDYTFYTNTRIEGQYGTIELDGIRIFNKELGIKNIFTSYSGYYNELEHFFEILSDKNKKFLVSVQEAKEAVKLCLAANKSAENNSQEIFLDDIE